MTKRRSPGAKSRATSTTTTIDEHKSTPEFADLAFDKHIIGTVDRSIWEAIFNGHYRLAVRCERCGRWLTSGRAKKARMGAHCASKAEVGE